MKTIVSDYPISTANKIKINTSLQCNINNYYTYPSRTVKYIVIHYTGNAKDTARNNANYFSTGSRGASAHYFVDDTSIYQSVPLHNSAWAVGGTTRYKHAECRNLNSVSIEMCTSGDYKVSAQTELNTAYLCAELCKYIGITADKVDMYVLRHYDVWDKECPKYWTGYNNKRWNEFKSKVKAILTESEDLTLTQYEELKSKIEQMEKMLNTNKIESFVYDYPDENMKERADYAIEPVKWAKKNGIILGIEKDKNGEPRLHLVKWQLWTLTIIYRTAKYLMKLVNIKI